MRIVGRRAWLGTIVLDSAAFDLVEIMQANTTEFMIVRSARTVRSGVRRNPTIG
jgi:hypothetical protein